MRSSHVGSFPLPYREECIDKILVDLASIGLDVPTYPQMRSFIDIYLEPLVSLGILYKRGENYFSTPEKLLGTKIPSVDVPEARLAIDIVKRRDLVFKGLRAPVTGVFTLASRIYIEEDISKGLSATVLARRDIIEGFLVPYVEAFVKLMVDLGYTAVFLDEPALGLIVGKRRILYSYTEDFIVDILDRVLKPAKAVERGIHVCGTISPKLFEILTTVPSIKFLNFEFHDTPQNLDIVKSELLEQYDKFLAPGIASAKKPVVESIEELRNLLDKVYRAARGRIDLVSADCGFGGLRGTLGSREDEYRVALEKLRNISLVVKSFSS